MKFQFAGHELIVHNVYIYLKCSVVFIQNVIAKTVQMSRNGNDPSLFLKLRSFQNLHNMWHYNYRYFVQTAYIFLAKLDASLVIYSIVIFWDLSAVKLVFASAIFYFYLYVELTTAGNLYASSDYLLKKWQRKILTAHKGILNRPCKCLLKQIDSVKPFACHVGIFYSITTNSLLTVANEIMNNTLTLLLL